MLRSTASGKPSETLGQTNMDSMKFEYMIPYIHETVFT